MAASIAKITTTGTQILSPATLDNNDWELKDPYDLSDEELLALFQSEEEEEEDQLLNAPLFKTKPIEIPVIGDYILTPIPDKESLYKMTISRGLNHPPLEVLISATTKERDDYEYYKLVKPAIIKNKPCLVKLKGAFTKEQISAMERFKREPPKGFCRIEFDHSNNPTTGILVKLYGILFFINEEEKRQGKIDRYQINHLGDLVTSTS